jgi:hypothetical protein
VSRIHIRPYCLQYGDGTKRVESWDSL